MGHGSKLVLASHNEGKLREIRDLVAPLGIHAVSAADLGVPEPEETGVTFEENADLKARLACEETGLPSLADDTGLCVDALDGAPGIYTARWAGVPRDFSRAMDRLQGDLAAAGALDVRQRTARLVCVLSLAVPGQPIRNFRGEIEGTIALSRRGDLGFGFDPVFEPVGSNSTYGEMSGAVRHADSHRTRAFRKLLEALPGLALDPMAAA